MALPSTGETISESVLQPEWALSWNVGAHSAAQLASLVPPGPSLSQQVLRQLLRQNCVSLTSILNGSCSCTCHVGYDYTVLIAMSPVIQQAFFPKGDLAAKQLSFW